jgi:hypothetical protein
MISIFIEYGYQINQGAAGFYTGDSEYSCVITNKDSALMRRKAITECKQDIRAPIIATVRNDGRGDLNPMQVQFTRFQIFFISAPDNEA